MLFYSQIVEETREWNDEYKAFINPIGVIFSKVAKSLINSHDIIHQPPSKIATSEENISSYKANGSNIMKAVCIL